MNIEVLVGSTGIGLTAFAPYVIRACVLNSPTPATTPAPGNIISTPVPPGVEYETLPVIDTETQIIDTSPDQIIGCANELPTGGEQQVLDSLFPEAISGDGVINRSNNDIWTYDGSIWTNVGPTPGPQVVVVSVLPPWNEVNIYTARIRARLEADSLNYALGLLTAIPALSIKTRVSVLRVFAIRPPAVALTIAALAPGVSSGGSARVPVTPLTLALAAPVVSGGASVPVPAGVIVVTALSPEQAGPLKTQVFIPSVEVVTAAVAPAIGSGASVAAPSKDITVVGVIPSVSTFEPEATVYIAAVETADGQPLESAVKIAINSFVVGCKSDGIWSAIKAACILAGARTLSGALVPLVGTAPTNNNFVSGDYNRETGLVGDGSTKYLDSNRNNNADPQNSNHNASYATVIGAANGTFIGSNSTTEAGTNGMLGGTSNTLFTRNRTSTGTANAAIPSTGFVGVNRSGSASYIQRVNSSNSTVSVTSATPFDGNVFIYARGSGAPSFATHRLAFYSIGESLDLALLDTRVTRLLNEIEFSLNTGLSGTSYDIDTLKYINAGYAAGGSLG